MKRLSAIFLSLMIILGLSGGMTAPASAASSVKESRAAYEKAVRNEKAAEEALEKAKKQFNEGSYGFYQWIIDNYDGWREEDARKALLLLEITSYKEYTVKGNEDDATSLDNMKSCVELLPVLAADRANDEFYTYLQPPTILNLYMARAQVNANTSSYTWKHTYSDPGCVLEDGSELGESGENLAWGYSNPFYGWYDKEKQSFIAKRNFTLEKYGVDISTPEWSLFIYNDDFDYNTYLAETKSFGETGHYHTVCAGYYDEYKYSDPPELKRIGVERKMHDRVYYGLGYSGYGTCHSLTLSAGSEESYSVEEYTELFNKYYNLVYPQKEIDAYERAKTNTKTALASLKASVKAAKTKPSVKRSGKTLRVKWKKVSGVSGYQISVSEKKGKTSVAATTGAKAKSKKIKLKKSKRQYVKIRSFTVVDGKRMYSKWSKAIRSR